MTAKALKPMIISPEECLDHYPGYGHPERPQRVGILLETFRQSGILQDCMLVPARPATFAELELAHPKRHVEAVRVAVESGARALDGDTGISDGSLLAAQMAAGAALTGVDRMVQGEAKRIFCGVRPPGHHAEPEKAMGFCLFNNVAIAARYAQAKGLAENVLILDWDVHHGNGTQAIFEADPTVFYYSLHQYPFYPGTGAAGEIGIGAGTGYTLNRPLEAGGKDDQYFRLLEKDLRHIADTFAPDLVIISAGFDAHEDDPLGAMRVTTGGFGAMTDLVKALADQCANGKILSVLEGGYDLDALADSVQRHLESLCQ